MQKIYSKKIETIAKEVLCSPYDPYTSSSIIGFDKQIADWEKLLIANRVERLLGIDVDDNDLKEASTLAEIINSFGHKKR